MRSPSKASALRRVASALVAVVIVAVPAAGADAKTKPAFGQNPVLFVHGIEGSGAQFDSQNLRFMSNGYPKSWLDEVDYNSTRAVGDKSEVDQQIDDAIAALKQRTGRSKVDVVAHSLGTSVMYDYLTNGSMAAQRRANVGHYINVDGQDQDPRVRTLAVWAGRGEPGRHMDGAQNVTIPNQTHVQTCSSAESFLAYYKFLTGRRPAHDILRQRGPIMVAGKALDFPRNVGLSGATVQIWRPKQNGVRATATPRASIPITDGSQGGGEWGPVAIQPGVRYEFALVRPAQPTLHIYYEPFVRSDYTLRLLSSTAIETYAGNRPGSMSAVNIRYKELWGDQGAQNDKLLVDGLNICTANLCPISKQVNAFFAFDRNREGGKGQLSAAYAALEELGLANLVAVGIAKKEELLYSRDRDEPIALASNDPALLLVQRMRDEAHRFAVTFHRQARTMRDLRSELDEVPGVGKRRRRELLTKFGSVAGVRRATREELSAAVGAKLADAVLAFFASRP